MKTKLQLIILLISTLLSTQGCDDQNSEAKGRIIVQLDAEDLIIEGLSSGSSPNQIQDGWSVQFDRYLVTLGGVVVRRAGESSRATDPSQIVLDLSSLPTSGLELWSIEDLGEGRWDFFYESQALTGGGTRHQSVNEADFDEMQSSGWTYLIEGQLTQEDGKSCPPSSLAEPGDAVPLMETEGENPCYAVQTIRFRFGAQAATQYGPCEVDGLSGVSVTANQSRIASISIHGDHLFFNGFPEGDEGGIIRLAQWLADCDLNLDGEVTQTELEQISPDLLPELDDRFQIGGAPISPLENMYEYVRAQLMTQGHFQGEGECPLKTVTP